MLPKAVQILTTKRHKRAFSFIEIMFILVIIGILFAIAIPAYVKHRQEAREKHAFLTLEGLIPWFNSGTQTKELGQIAL